METIRIDGRDYLLKLGVGACRRVEKELGKSVFEALGTTKDGQVEMPSMQDLVTLCWGALLINDANMNFDEAEKLVDAYFDEPENDMESLLKKLVASINFIKAQPVAKSPEVGQGSPSGLI